MIDNFEDKLVILLKWQQAATKSLHPSNITKLDIKHVQINIIEKQKVHSKKNVALTRPTQELFNHYRTCL